MLFVLINTGDFLLFMKPMEPWFVLACSLDAAARVDKFIGDRLGKFDGFYPFCTLLTVWYCMYCVPTRTLLSAGIPTGNYSLQKKAVPSSIQHGR
jgi:hypothetical protein